MLIFVSLGSRKNEHILLCRYNVVLGSHTVIHWCFVWQIAMSDVGESLSFDPSSHFELQNTDGNDIHFGRRNSCQYVVKLQFVLVTHSCCA